jgi:hypothetical protein
MEKITSIKFFLFTHMVLTVSGNEFRAIAMSDEAILVGRAL